MRCNEMYLKFFDLTVQNRFPVKFLRRHSHNIVHNWKFPFNAFVFPPAMSIKSKYFLCFAQPTMADSTINIRP